MDGKGIFVAGSALLVGLASYLALKNSDKHEFAEKKREEL